MSHALNRHSVSGYRQRLGAWNQIRIEHEHCPPFAIVMTVFGAAMTGIVWFSGRFHSFAGGWIAGLAIFAALGVFIHCRFSGVRAFERRIRRVALRQRRQPWRRQSGSAAPEWTSRSAYPRHPRSTKAARADSSPGSTRRDSRAECRIPPM